MDDFTIEELQEVLEEEVKKGNLIRVISNGEVLYDLPPVN